MPSVKRFPNPCCPDIGVVYDYRSTMTASTTQRTVFKLAAMPRDREEIAMLTCYDASFAALIGRAGVDV